MSFRFVISKSSQPRFIYNIKALRRKQLLSLHIVTSRRLGDATPRVAGSPRSRVAAKTENGRVSLLFSSAYLYLLANI